MYSVGDFGLDKESTISSTTLMLTPTYSQQKVTQNAQAQRKTSSLRSRLRKTWQMASLNHRYQVGIHPLYLPGKRMETGDFASTIASSTTSHVRTLTKCQGSMTLWTHYPVQCGSQHWTSYGDIGKFH